MPPRKPAASSTSFASSSKPTKRGKFDDPDPELDDLAGGAGDEEDLEDTKVSSPHPPCPSPPHPPSLAQAQLPQAARAGGA